jgi:hypothetical protein
MSKVKINFKIIIFSLVVSLLLASTGGRAGNFLSFGANARSIGLGRAFLGIADDASTVQINPAGMSQIKNIEMSLFQTGLYEGYNLMGLNLVYPLVDNTIGISFLQLSSQAMELRNKYNENEGSFTDSQMGIGVSYAQPIFIPSLSLGLTGTFVNRTLHQHSDSRVLGNAGLFFEPFDFLSLGAVVHNVIDFQLDNSSKDKFAPLPRVGVAYKDKFLTLAFDIENTLDNWFAGAEYLFNDFLTIRGGINYQSTNFGFSLSYSFMRFDYAFSNDDLGMNHRLSFNLGIGEFINNLQKDASVDWYKRAVHKYNHGFFLYSLEDMKKANILYPNNKDIKDRLDRLTKLESMSDTLNLDIRKEKQVWPIYQNALEASEIGDYVLAIEIIQGGLKNHENNINLLKLQKNIEEKIKKK